MRRRSWTALTVSAAVVAGAVLAVALIGQAQSSGIISPASLCLPATLRVAPGTAHPGQAVALSSGAAGCDLAYRPGHTYAVTLQHRETRTPPLRVVVAPDGSFETAVPVPPTFPPGDAVISVTGSPYDDCEDTRSGSCAGYWVALVVE